MELLTALGIDWRLLLWQAVNFLIVLFVLKRYAFGPIIEALARRTARLEQGLRDADTAKRSLADAERERQALLAETRVEAGSILKDARARADALHEETLAKARKDVEAVVQQGRAAMAAEKTAMVAAARAELAVAVVAGVEKVLPRVMEPADHARLVAAAGDALRGKI